MEDFMTPVDWEPLVAIVQARVGSTRFPGKVLKSVIGTPLIGHLIERLRRAPSVSRVVLAIPDSAVNDDLANAGALFGAEIFRGSELDVLDRFAKAAKSFRAGHYLRVTGDCPLVDPDLVEALYTVLKNRNLDYACTGPAFPDGLDLELFSSELLFEAAESAREPFEREHVTPYMKKVCEESPHTMEFEEDMSFFRLTVDEPEDFAVVSRVFEFFGDNKFSLGDVVALQRREPTLFFDNQHFVRNEGSQLSTGAKLWRRARKVIPGGSMLLSKKAELFSQRLWPSYYSRAKGCRVWDLEDRLFFDTGYMGVGTNLLGYGHSLVDSAVTKIVEAGNLSSLNAPEEVELAEELCQLHSWAEMARFTRSGGEACAVAIRIARAASGKSGVAVCGYHGWHDWYLSANLAGEDALGHGHLLPGLLPTGVPGQLVGTVHAFDYNKIDQLREILQRGDVGTIFMEVERNVPPQEGFLEEVRQLASQYQAVLVFDECTSGFREVLGGIHLKYGISPDIAIFGKTLGNGYAINAVIGRREVMESAESTFISSTFWTERIGSAAALASLRAMKEEDGPQRVHNLGLEIRKRWVEMGQVSGLSVATAGLPALSTYSVEGYSDVEVKTFVVEQMISRGYLAPPAFYASIAHSRDIVDVYLDRLGEVFAQLGSIDPEDLGSVLPYGVAQSGFSRLN